ncbi:MAG: hypothetical protein NDI69_09245 [Bacteriovoracaceae bacterium]|nr:hypothetical protein [Bacteriovoracaceae bacterium]
MNWIPPLIGVLNRSIIDLAGSAESFAGTVNNTDKFYVQYFARNCTSVANCTEINEATVPSGELIKIIQCNYVVPGTTRGTDPARF